MPTNPVHAEISRPLANHETIAARVTRNTKLLPEIFAGLTADKARIKFGCLKVLRLISETKPAVLYPEFDRFVDLLDSDNQILKWGGIIIIGNLAAVDAKKKIDRILDRYLWPISEHAMITAANVVRGAAKIAVAKPHLADKIALALLQVETARYQTAECRNVALGHVIGALDLFFGNIREVPAVIAFARRQLCNRRNAVRRKASAFLKKHARLT